MRSLQTLPADRDEGLFYAAYKAFEAAELAPLPPGTLRMCRRVKPLYGRPAYMEDRLRGFSFPARLQKSNAIRAI